MYQVVKQTHEEKVEMYMKLGKKELVDMLIECNRMLEVVLPTTYDIGEIKKLKISERLLKIGN
jgi:hypothetical protein